MMRFLKEKDYLKYSFHNNVKIHKLTRGKGKAKRLSYHCKTTFKCYILNIFSMFK